MSERATIRSSTLQDMLAAATRIAQNLTGDRLAPRLDVFARMPVEDRETILMGAGARGRASDPDEGGAHRGALRAAHHEAGIPTRGSTSG
jgi:hypothetical protein